MVKCCGGHSEDPETAVKREILEEVGLNKIEIFTNTDMSFLDTTEDFKFLTQPQFVHRHKINETHDHLAMVFFVKTKTDKLNLSVNEKVSTACKWFTKEDLESNEYKLNESVKYMALKALTTLNS